MSGATIDLITKGTMKVSKVEKENWHGDYLATNKIYTYRLSNNMVLTRTSCVSVVWCSSSYLTVLFSSNVLSTDCTLKIGLLGCALNMAISNAALVSDQSKEKNQSNN